MTGRTLEEIEALAAEATPGPWMLEPTDPLCITRQDPGWASSDQLDIGFTNDPKRVAFMNHDVGDDSTEWFASQEKATANAALIAALPDLLTIAQGQREEIREADRRAGEAERHLAWEKESNRCHAEWLREAKKTWGVDDYTSFDVIWEECLALKGIGTKK